MRRVKSERMARRMMVINIDGGPQQKRENVMRLAISDWYFFLFLTFMFIRLVVNCELKVNVWALNSGIFSYFHDFGCKSGICSTQFRIMLTCLSLIDGEEPELHWGQWKINTGSYQGSSSSLRSWPWHPLGWCIAQRDLLCDSVRKHQVNRGWHQSPTRTMACRYNLYGSSSLVLVLTSSNSFSFAIEWLTAFTTPVL